MQLTSINRVWVGGNLTTLGWVVANPFASIGRLRFKHVCHNTG